MKKGKSGWFNESRRHSLASKGIKTGQKFDKRILWILDKDKKNVPDEVETDKNEQEILEKPENNPPDRPKEARMMTTPETAKIIRGQLKKKFPNQKFSVRSSEYANGSSINVSWEDGVPESEVEDLVNQYGGAGFDGMIDLKFYKKHWLNPDGTTVLADSEGTVGSAGVVPKKSNPKPSKDAELVHMGADYIHTNRHLSPKIQEKLSRQLADKMGIKFTHMNQMPFESSADSWHQITWRIARKSFISTKSKIKRTKSLSGTLEEMYEVVN